jgi:hypothetical protein
LFGVQHLRTVPMAALNVYLNRRVPNIPHGHVNLVDSPFGLSFIDVSQFWSGNPNTVLNMIASDFVSIQTLPQDDATRLLVEDIKRYIPTLRDEDIESTCLIPNLTEPLFMNDVGVWPFRPKSDTCIPNLFLAGDYCRSYVDIVSMEGAITSGLLAARALRERAGLASDIDIHEVNPPPLWWFVAIKWLLLPLVGIAKAQTLTEKFHYAPPPKGCPKVRH